MLNTAGPWRPVRLEVSFAHIENVLIKYVVSPDLKKIEGTIEVDVDRPFDKANVSIHLQENAIYTTTIEPTSKDRFSVSFTIGMYS
jgi:beta-mannosidase